MSHSLSEEITPRLLEILKIGYSSIVAIPHILDLGPGVAGEKSRADHKVLRKFSLGMLLRLHVLHKKSGSQSRLLNVSQSYLKFLISQKFIHKLSLHTMMHTRKKQP